MRKNQIHPGGWMIVLAGIINMMNTSKLVGMFTKTDAEDGVHWQEIDTTKFYQPQQVLDVGKPAKKQGGERKEWY